MITGLIPSRFITAILFTGLCQFPFPGMVDSWARTHRGLEGNESPA